MDELIARIRSAETQEELEAIAAEQGWTIRYENTAKPEVTVGRTAPGRSEDSIVEALRCAMLHNCGVN